MVIVILVNTAHVEMSVHIRAEHEQLSLPSQHELLDLVQPNGHARLLVRELPLPPPVLAAVGFSALLGFRLRLCLRSCRAGERLEWPAQQLELVRLRKRGLNVLGEPAQELVCGRVSEEREEGRVEEALEEREDLVEGRSSSSRGRAVRVVGGGEERVVCGVLDDPPVDDLEDGNEASCVGEVFPDRGALQGGGERVHDALREECSECWGSSRRCGCGVDLHCVVIRRTVCFHDLAEEGDGVVFREVCD